MDDSREKVYVDMENCDRYDERFNNCHSKKRRVSTERVLRAGLSVFILSILPNTVLSSDFDCGVNRFNNESPLTERIVGGNNSLQ